MSETYSFQEKGEFLNKLKDIVNEGVPKGDINVFSPYQVHEVDEILSPRPSGIKYFTLFGALTGTFTGFALTIYSALRWPLLITGGKPLVSIPAYIVIAYELTILFGSLATFFGFLLLARLPSVRRIIAPREHGNEFVIEIKSGAKK